MPRSSSPPAFAFVSSQAHDDTPGKRSRFTYRQLQLLRQHSTSTPLRVISHVDLDAFYAQCEMVRLGTPRETPLAVQQWDSLIAVNYPARPFGVSRMISATEAKKRCPDLITQHVATFREGEGGKWAYRDDAAQHIKTDKVSLDPYRVESRKIMAIMKGCLADWGKRITGDLSEEVIRKNSITPDHLVRLEKAGIDEVFLDLSALVYWTLMERYPELRQSGSGDTAELLPPPPTTALNWNAEDELVDLDIAETEDDDPDWDDVVTLVGAEIARAVRTAVWEKLSYTCSAGIARNKMMAKLGSGRHKPNKQTIVRNRAVQQFLSGFKFTKIRMLGGKLGDQVVSLFGTEEVTELLKVPIEQLKSKLDDGTASWLYGIIRGEDHSEVGSRTQIKSMLSAKSFRPSINSADQAQKWLRIFAADIYNRLVEEGVVENKRRPKTITLHHRQGGQMKSRQLPIPGGKPVDEATLFELANTLLHQVVSQGHVWPCAHLSLSVGGFEDGVTKNRAIEGFLVRGEEAKEMKASSKEHDNSSILSEIRPEKRRKTDRSGIQKFFQRKPEQEGWIDSAAQEQEQEQEQEQDPDLEHNAYSSTEYSGWLSGLSGEDAQAPRILERQAFITEYLCPRCGGHMPEFQQTEHMDWHFAKDLESEESRSATPTAPAQSTVPAGSKGGGRGRGKSGRGRGRGRGAPEKGQSRLEF